MEPRRFSSLGSGALTFMVCGVGGYVGEKSVGEISQIPGFFYEEMFPTCVLNVGDLSGPLGASSGPQALENIENFAKQCF